MKVSRTLGMFVIAALTCCANADDKAVSNQAEADASSERPLFHADPQHLWNRLYHALFVRVGPDGRAYGHDRLEPLLWPATKHLLEDASNHRAVDLLTEFLENSGESLIEDPLKRAILQRDLWLVFNWLEYHHGSFAEPRLDAAAALAAQQRLRGPLAAVIGRLALNPKQIQNLPDNYAAAAGDFPGAFDARQPDRPYLPADLFAAWVCVGRTDGRTAPQHLRDDNNAFTNSVFTVFVRLPEGRAATIDHLEQLAAFDKPLLNRNPNGSSIRRFLPNPQLPQFPVGTELALVRQALLIDSAYRVVASPLVESVQLRVMRGDYPSLTPQLLDEVFGGSATARNERLNSWQSFQEFRLSRRQLFDAEGGLSAVGPGERDFKTGFRAHAFDEFEMPVRPGQSFPSQRFPIIQNCLACHSLPGVYSFNSLQDFRSGSSRDGDQLRPFPVAVMSASDVAASAVKWKVGQPNWTALRELLDSVECGGSPPRSFNRATSTQKGDM